MGLNQIFIAVSLAAAFAITASYPSASAVSRTWRADPPSHCLAALTDIAMTPNGRTVAYFTDCDGRSASRRRAYLFRRNITSGSAQIENLELSHSYPKILGYADNSTLMFLTTNDEEQPSSHGVVIWAIDAKSGAVTERAKIETQEPIFGVSTISGADGFMVSARSRTQTYIFRIDQSGRASRPTMLAGAVPVLWNPVEDAYLVAAPGPAVAEPMRFSYLKSDGELYPAVAFEPFPGGLDGIRIRSADRAARAVYYHVPGVHPSEGPPEAIWSLSLTPTSSLERRQIKPYAAQWPERLAIAPEGMVIAVKYADRIEVISVSDFRIQKTIQLPKSELAGEIAISRDGKAVIVCSNGNFFTHDL